MANAVLNMADYPSVEAPQRPALRLVEPSLQPKMAPPSWMMAPPIPAEIKSVSVNEPQQPYLPINMASASVPVSQPTPMVSDNAPYRHIREVPRRY